VFKRGKYLATHRVKLITYFYKERYNVTSQSPTDTRMRNTLV